MASEANLRAADSDRERAVELLRRHHDAGRLDHDDLEERLQAVYRARTYGDLDVLFGDLPALPSPRSALPAMPAAGPQAAGTRGFTYRGIVDGHPEHVAHRATQHLEPILRRGRYRLEHRDPTRLVFSRKRTPGWAWPVAIIGVPVSIALVLVPASLAVLLVKSEDRITLEFEPTGDGRTHVTAYGIAERQVRRGLAELTG